MRPRVRSYIRQHHVGLLALIIALSGTAYAAAELSRNQVRSKHIAPRAVKRSDVAPNTVNSAKVANGALRSVDFAPGQLPSGPTGPQGATGETGATGPSGATDIVIRQSDDTPGWTIGEQLDHFASCEAGETAVGGGWESLNHSNYNQITPRVLRPNDSQTWNVIANSGVEDTDAFLRVYVLCASP